MFSEFFSILIFTRKWVLLNLIDQILKNQKEVVTGTRPLHIISQRCYWGVNRNTGR